VRTGEERLAAATQKGMARLGRLSAGARLDAVVIAAPHNVHVSGALGVVVAGRVTGRLSGAPPGVALDVPSDVTPAWQVLAALGEAGIPSVGITFGGNDPVSAVAPMDWGVLIPLWFLGGRSEPPVPIVVVTPARHRPASVHVRGAGHRPGRRLHPSP
jgi:aromatic ring-opening dioxygenase LigB subunit